MYYLGIDHHKRFCQVAVMDEKGKVHINCRMANEKTSFDVLKRRLNSNEPLRTVIEAGGNWGNDV